MRPSRSSSSSPRAFFTWSLQAYSPSLSGTSRTTRLGNDTLPADHLVDLVTVGPGNRRKRFRDWFRTRLVRYSPERLARQRRSLSSCMTSQVWLTRQSAAIPRLVAAVDGVFSTLCSAGRTPRHMALSSHTSSTGLWSFSYFSQCGTTKRMVIGRSSRQRARWEATDLATVATQRKARSTPLRNLLKAAVPRQTFAA